MMAIPTALEGDTHPDEDVIPIIPERIPLIAALKWLDNV